MKTNKKYTIEHCCILAEQYGGKCLSITYVNRLTKLLWECGEGHKWKATFGNVKCHNSWCPVCAKKKKKTIEDCRRLAEQHGGKCLSTKYINNKKKYTWECDEGHQWDAVYASVRNGTWCPSCAPEKKKQTNLSRYGVEYALQSVIFQNKIKQTNLEKYGVECTLQNDTVKKKIKNTNLEKYGVEYPGQNKEIAMKQALSSNNSGTVLHWKTREELVWKGSYERTVLQYLNQNQIDFQWQPEVFKTPILTSKDNKSTFRPDLFLTEENKWIEIKGFFRKDAEEKWNWFKSIYPTAELWDKKKLKQLGIL
jgi:hypothetical protein